MLGWKKTMPTAQMIEEGHEIKILVSTELDKISKKYSMENQKHQQLCDEMVVEVEEKVAVEEAMEKVGMEEKMEA